MRWAELLADLEAQLDAEAAADLSAEVADRTRAELGRVAVGDRADAARGFLVTALLPGGPVAGTVADAGPGWVLLTAATGDVLVATARVPLAGLPRAAAPQSQVAPAGRDRVRPDLRRAIRAVVRDRSPIDLHVAGGAVLHGTPDRVGLDHLDLAEHGVGEPRRADAVRRVVTVPLEAVLAAVRRDG